MGSDKHKKSHKRKYSDDSEADASESSGEAIVGINPLVVYPYFLQTAAVTDVSQQHKKSKKHKKDKAKKVR